MVVEIYDRSRDKDSRKKLYSSEGSSEQILVYEPKNLKNSLSIMWYKGDGVEETGCLVFILGYQLTFLDDTIKKIM